MWHPSLFSIFICWFLKLKLKIEEKKIVEGFVIKFKPEVQQSK